MRPAVFLDRDGVINAMCLDPDHGLVDSPLNASQFELLSGACEAIKRLNDVGYFTVVVSNQPSVAKGKMTQVSLGAISERMRLELRRGGARLDAVYYCFHHPEAALEPYRVECECRKPKPGLILQAARALHIDLACSFMVGDGVTDIEAGHRAGCRTIWIGQMGCAVCKIMQERGVKPDWIANNLTAAVELILRKDSNADLS